MVELNEFACLTGAGEAYQRRLIMVFIPDSAPAAISIFFVTSTHGSPSSLSGREIDSGSEGSSSVNRPLVSSVHRFGALVRRGV